MTRQERFDALIDFAGGEGGRDEVTTFLDTSVETHRFAAVQREWYGEVPAGGGVWLTQTIEEAFDALVDAVLSGDEADGVYDLETGQKVDIHVSVKVTASEDQGAGYNPLEDL